MKNRFALILGTLILAASAVAGAQVSEQVPLQPQEQGRNCRDRRRDRDRRRPSPRPALPASV